MANRLTVIVLLFIFAIHIGLRFYQLEERAVFAWDQVDNAWVSKNLIVDHKFPVVGMPAKQSSGLFIGPFYYYIVAFFYWLFDLDPIASPIIAGISSLFSIFVLYFVSFKLFGTRVALICSFIYAVSYYSTIYNRIQWPVSLIPSISFLIFFALYKILNNEVRYTILLAASLGFSIHLNLIALFYFIIFALCLPFFPRSKEALKFYFLPSILLAIFFIPSIIYFFQSSSSGDAFSNFAQYNYHGVHLKRFIQTLPNIFVEFERWLFFDQALIFRYFIPPIFLFIYLRKKFTKERIIFVCLLLLWFTVPWVILSTYKGELTEYYYTGTNMLSILIISYLLGEAWGMNTYAKGFILLFFLIYAWFNLNAFLAHKIQGLSFYKKKVYQEVIRGEENMFLYGAPDTYLHYYYKRKLKEEE